MSNPEKDIQILLCPECKTRVPFIKVVLDNRTIWLRMYCPCYWGPFFVKIETYLDLLPSLNITQEHICSKDSHEHLIAQKYCSICRKWMCQYCLVLHNQIDPNCIKENLI